MHYYLQQKTKLKGRVAGLEVGGHGQGMSFAENLVNIAFQALSLVTCVPFLSPPNGAGEDAAGAAREEAKALQDLTAAAVEASRSGPSNNTPAVESAPPENSTGGDRPPPTHNGAAASATQQLQEDLLFLLSTLDRGLAASQDDVLRVDNAVRRLESAAGTVVMSEGANMANFGGRWRLAYSSAFAGGNLGGARPGPQASLVPFNLGQVYQDISLVTMRLDNVVSFSAKYSLASWPGSGAEPPTVSARLKHTFEVLGANTVRITYDSTVVKGSGGLGGWLSSLPEVATPQLPEPLRSAFNDARSATFDIVFLNEEKRITRGDRGELRVFVKDPGSGPAW